MQRFTFLLLMFICLCWTKKQPNIVILLTDDQDLLLGGMDRMPHLKEKLMNHGTTFTNAFVHTPICCPSRSSILTGRYLHNGLAKNNSVEGNCNGKEWQEVAEPFSLAVYAQEAGYLTSYAGKYLNTYGCTSTIEPECTRVPPGWSKWFGLVGNSRYYNYSLVVSENGGETSELVKHGDDYAKDYLPDAVANRTLNMIKEAILQGKPFLVVNAWPTPHGPFTPSPWAEHVFDGYKAPRTANWNASTLSMKQKHWIMRQLAPIDEATEQLIDTTYQRRLEALLSVDNHIDKIVQLLQDTGELDNTVIVYTSDNGYQLGQHRLAVDKRHLYEHDVRVPFIVRHGSGKARLCEEIVLNIDIAPTIYELVTGSNDIPETMDGQSFASLLDDDDEASARDDFLISYHGEGFMPCGMAECPPDPHGGWMPDSWNNTYHCVRTIVGKNNYYVAESHLSSKDSIYCRFEDDEKFVEYYDLSVDPFQLANRYNELSVEEKKYFEDRLLQLRSCRGSGCRERRRPTLAATLQD